MTDTLDRLTTALQDRYAIQRELGAGGMATVLKQPLKIWSALTLIGIVTVGLRRRACVPTTAAPRFTRLCRLGNGGGSGSPEVVETSGVSCPRTEGGGDTGALVGKRRRRLLWAEAMKRGLSLDVPVCENCGGRREVLKFITDPRVIVRILDHLRLPTSPPVVSSAR